MNKMQLVVKIFSWIEKKRMQNAVRKGNKKCFDLYKKTGIEIKKLSSEQKKQVDAIYKKYGLKYSYDTHELTYSVTGEFDAKIMPEDMFRMYIEPVFNKAKYKSVFSNKGYFELFMPDAVFPETIVKNMDGCFYDSKFNLISEAEARNAVSAFEKVVVKPINDSGKGRGVCLVDVSEDDPFEKHKSDYVIQRVFSQHSTLAALNETSVNCLRLITLFIENEVYLLASMLKIGGKGEFADNTTSKNLPGNEGRITIGISEDGRLHEKGYLVNGLTVSEAHNGIKFSDVTVPCYHKMIDEVKKQHKKFPMIRFIAWDVTLTESGEVVIMEYNTKNPGIQYVQYTNGAVFGEMTEEFMKYIKKS